jgi:hypothetical protein
MQTKISRLILLAAIACAFLSQNSFCADGTGLKPGIYTEGADGKFHAITNINIAALWPGTWKDGTNGLRVELKTRKENGQMAIDVGVGSVAFNSLGGYVGAPDGEFEKFELTDTNGVVVPFVKGASLEGHFPSIMSIKVLPRSPFGELNNHIAFFTNGGPFTLSVIKFDDVYRIKNEADYTLTVCAVIYKFGTNLQYLDRIDLPCVATKIHLVPSPVKQ